MHSPQSIIACLLLFLLISCGEETLEPALDFGRDYYPIEVGQTWVYAYDSIVYNRQTSTIDTMHGQIRETVTEELVEVSGARNYRLLREHRRDDTQPWQHNTVWRIEVDEDKLIRTEENLSFIKLTYPTKLGNQWDGNARIDQYLDVEVNGDPIQVYINWDYEIIEKDASREIEGILHNDVLVVQEVDAEDGLGLRRVESTYARHLGLVAREMTILDCSNSCDPAIPWPARGDKGFTLSLRYIGS